jgi:hypothetical protein
VKYWGGDTGGREFRLLVDGEELAAQTLDNNRPGEFYEETYPLPERLTQGKQKITLKFPGPPGEDGGRGLRLLRSYPCQPEIAMILALTKLPVRFSLQVQAEMLNSR